MVGEPTGCATSLHVVTKYSNSYLYGLSSFYAFRDSFKSAAIELESILSTSPVFQEAEVVLVPPPKRVRAVNGSAKPLQ